jgi:16S rRNA (adenine1518-N6/adenine1519-N6)-dimethyltransferase
VPILHDKTKDFRNIEIINEDILKLDWQKFGKLKIIGNIPYNISTEILLNLLKHINMWDTAVLTAQRELTYKILASPCKSGYRAFTVLFDYYTERKKLFSVSASMFRPSPKISSTAVLIKKRISPVSIDIDFKALSVVVQASFKQPRKTIANNLSMFLNIDKAALIRTTNLDLTRRAESFSTTDFCQLTKDLRKSKNIYDESIVNAFYDKS